MDEIQADLERWHNDGDQRAGLRVVRALTPLWRAKVRAMFRTSEDRVDEILQEMMATLLTSSKAGAPPRALAPTGHTSAAAWRNKVLRNEMISHRRKQAPREAAEDAAVHELTREGTRELRARRKAEGKVELHVVKDPRDPTLEAITLAEDRADARQFLLRALPKISVRYRVAVALRLGIDASPWAGELARVLGEEAGPVAARLAAVLDGTLDEVSALYPDADGSGGPRAADADAHRKTVDRGADRLRDLLLKEGR